MLKPFWLPIEFGWNPSDSWITLRTLGSCSCHIVLWAVLTPCTVSALLHSLSPSGWVEGARGTRLRCDSSHWTVETLGTNVGIGILCGGGAVGPTCTVVPSLTAAHWLREPILITVHSSWAGLTVRQLGPVGLVVKRPGGTGVLVGVGCVEWAVVSGGTVGVIVKHHRGHHIVTEVARRASLTIPLPKLILIWSWLTPERGRATLWAVVALCTVITSGCGRVLTPGTVVSLRTQSVWEHISTAVTIISRCTLFTIRDVIISSAVKVISCLTVGGWGATWRAVGSSGAYVSYNNHR